jgi:hypothetical protein
VRARFPEAQPLPDRPELDGLLEEIRSPLRWDQESGAYRTLSLPTTTSLSTRGQTRIVTATALDGLPVDDVDRWLRDSLDQHGFLAIGVDPRRLDLAVRVLTVGYDLEPVDVTAVLLGRMRQLAQANGIPWEEVLVADADDPASERGRGLHGLVDAAMEAVKEAIDDATAPLLLTEVAPLARYGQLRLLDRQADHTTRRPAALWVLLPAGELTPAPLVDGEPLTVLSPAQWLKIPDEWLERRSAPAPAGGPR